MSENYTKGIQRILKYAKEEAIRLPGITSTTFKNKTFEIKEQQEKYGNVNVNATTTTWISTNADGTISTTTNTANDVDKISATGSSDLKLTGERDALVSDTTTNATNSDIIVEFNKKNAKGGNINNFSMVDLGANIINWAGIASKIDGRKRTERIRRRKEISLCWNNKSKEDCSYFFFNE